MRVRPERAADGYHMPPVAEKGHVPEVQIPARLYTHEGVAAGYIRTWPSLPLEKRAGLPEEEEGWGCGASLAKTLFAARVTPPVKT